MSLGSFDLVSKLRSELSGLRLLPTLSSSSPPLPATIDGILEDLEVVETRWRMVRSVVADAEERQIREQSVREWLRELRDLAYLVEDVLDLYQYQLAADQLQVETDEVHPLEDLSFWLDIAERVAKIMQRFDDISRSKELLALNEPDGWKEDNSSIACLLPNKPVWTESKLVGRKEQFEELLRLLQADSAADSAEYLEVISIVGAGGAGKTSLAQHIFQHLKDLNHFSLVGWVSVPENCSLTRLTIETARAFGRDDSLELQKLKEAIMTVAFREKLFLVMDGIGRNQMEYWNEFMEPFRSALIYGGSKILITTREEEVAQAARAASSIKLGGLGQDEGWSLLQQHAFSNPEEEHPQQLVAIGKDIVNRSGGLPITLKVLGRFLRTVKEDEDKWKHTLESDIWDVVQVAGSEEHVLVPLYFCYLRLPTHLKTCFRYCSFFQRGEFIDRKKLVEFWLVNNLIRDDHGGTLNEVADGYFNDLESRSFLEYVSDPRGKNGYIIHDLLVDILQFISGEEFCTVQGMEWNLPSHARHARFLEESNSSQRHHYSILASSDLRSIWMSGPAVIRGEPPSSVQISHASSLRILSSSNVSVSNLNECLAESKLLNVLSICFDMDDDDDDDCIDEDIGLDSLYLLYNLRQLNLRKVPIDELPSSISNLRNLTHLEISEARLAEIPEAVGALQKLIILKLTFLGISGLPESLGELGNLEALDLRACMELSELPRGITNLTKLQSLVAEAGYMPSGFSRLKELRNLPLFFVGKAEDGQAGIVDLRNMPHLQGMISIFGLENVTSDEAKECAMSDKHLHKLHLVWSSSSDGPGSSEDPKEVLENLRPHTDIKELGISCYKGISFPIWMGDTSFANLVTLKLELFTRCTSISSLGRLPSLGYLQMVEMESLIELASVQSEEDVSFPKLKELVVYSCDSLKFVPLYKFSSLVSLRFEQCQFLEKIDFTGSTGKPLDFLETVYIKYCGDDLGAWIRSNRCSILGHIPTVFVDDFPVFKEVPNVFSIANEVPDNNPEEDEAAEGNPEEEAEDINVSMEN